jgi:hypothetical protein
METMNRDFISIEHGFVIRHGNGGGFYEMNGLGDWTFAGSERTAALYTDKEEAEEMVKGFPEDELEVIEVHRTTLFYYHPLDKDRLKLLRKLVNG